MTRTASLCLLSLTLSACGVGGGYQHSSTVPLASRGIAIVDDITAQTGMSGNTCMIDVPSGFFLADIDVAQDTDHIEDSSGQAVLVRGSDGLHSFLPGQPSTLLLSGYLLDGALIDTGVVGVTADPGGLTARWSGDVQAEVSLPDARWEDSTADPLTGTVFIAHDGLVEAIEPQGDSLIIGVGNLTVWDAVAEVLYVATVGGTQLAAYERDGSQRFATHLMGPIHAMAPLGGTGSVMVAVDDGGQGVVLHLDGISGRQRTHMSLPGPVDGLAASPSGNTLGFVSGDRVLFFHR